LISNGLLDAVMQNRIYEKVAWLVIGVLRMDARHRLVVVLVAVAAVHLIRLVTIHQTSVLLELVRLHEVVNRGPALGKTLLMLVVLVCLMAGSCSRLSN